MGRRNGEHASTRRASIGRRAFAAAGAMLGLVACSSDDTVSEPLDDPPSTSPTADETEVTAAEDQRAGVLAELGAPDAFVIQVGELEDGAARFESWSYFGASTQIDFLDGEVLWDIEIEPVEDGALLPLLYSPVEFDLLASKADTLARLADVELAEADASELEIEGAEILAGEQLLLAFVDDRLVHVESYVLAPGEQEIE